MRHRQWRKRLAKLDVLLPQAPAVDVQERQKRRRQVVHRLVQLCEQACELMTEGEQISVAEGIRQWAETERGPYAWWFRALFRGCCRLPELPLATMKQLLVVWLSPECDPMTPVCQSCGLLYPHPRVPPLNEWKLLPGKVPLVGPPPWYDLPAFFPSCPGCGASALDIDWSHLVDGHDLPWMTLDGYVGRPVRGNLGTIG